MATVVSILIGGKAGQGIASVEMLLTRGFKRSGYYTFATKEYMSRIRGGSNTTLVMVSDAPVNAPVWRVDIAIPLDNTAFEHMKERIGPETLLIGGREGKEYGCRVLECDLEGMAHELGNPLVSNTIASGAVFALLGLKSDALRRIVGEKFPSQWVETNLSAITAGEKMVAEGGGCRYCTLFEGVAEVSEGYFLSGSEAIGFGALAGGCRFVSSYPMSPSTGVLTFLAQKGKTFGVCVEQAEDEIGAFQMALGAWYGGGRGMSTTSGGGFALMGEGMSLAGMTETPMVVYLAQRPGPATGLPTRTEQGDLELALYAGHGEFPRILLAPGDIDEAFSLTAAAFDLAERYQVPAVVLADQYLADSYYTAERFGEGSVEPSAQIVMTDKSYRRYAITEGGISPRGVPGFGEGIVMADSDEHTEEGLITERMEVRIAQHEKRLGKLERIREASIPPWGEGGEITVVGWGSTKHIIRTALERLGDARVGQLHFSWLYPLGEEQLAPLRGRRAIIVVENNATGQFARVLRMQGIAVDRQILRYDGLSFFADELGRELAALIKEIG